MENHDEFIGMKDRLLYLFRFYLLTVAIFLLAKVAFMLYNMGEESFSVGDVFQVFWHGLTLDLSTALYILILPFLFTVASIWLRLPRWLFVSYYIFVSFLFALAFVADTSLYPFWHFKLDASCLQYLETPTEAMASVTWGYLVLRAIGLIVLMGLMSVGYIRLAGQPDGGRGRWWEVLVYVALLPPFVIGIRGGLAESTTNIGQVYYSQNQFLNHSAVNPVFSFFSSFEKTANYVPDYVFMSDAECTALLDGCYPTESLLPDTLLRTSRPNIVVVLMESCGAIFTGLEGHADIMPRLSRLMDEGVSFDSCYANSWRTDRGTVCTYSGYPSFPISSVMKMPHKTYLLPGLARSLQRAGYDTHYIYGGDINFTNMRNYLVVTGFEGLTWMDDYSYSEQSSAKWGVRDDITFKTLLQLITQPREKPFFIGFSTLSSHEPWDVPLKRLEHPVANSFAYLDDCIGQLVDTLRRSPQWDNTLLIFLPDHGFAFEGLNESDKRFNHIPQVWTGGAVAQPRRIATICNQSDLPATLLGQLGLPHEDFRFSRDVMSRNYVRPFAVHTYNNGISVVDSTGFAVYDLNANRISVAQSPEAERLVNLGKAVLQTAAEDFHQMAP